MKQYYVYFILDGILGRETFEITSEAVLDQYGEAFAKFHDYAKQIGASWIEGARSAWDHVPIYHGPKTLYAVPA
jgi:hypothetical protein